MSCNIYWEDNGFVAEFYGEVTGSEYVDANRQFLHDSRYYSANYYIWDMSGVTKIKSSDEANLDVAAENLGAAISGKRILKGVHIAKKESPAYEVNLEYVEFLNSAKTPWQLQIFDNIVEARKSISS